MATFTSTVYKSEQPKFGHVGDRSVSGQLLLTAATSAGDVGFLAKVPHGAKIVDFYEYHTAGSTAGAALAVSFGFNTGIAAGGGANLSCLIASGAGATMNRLSLAASPVAGNGPVRISLSDLAVNRYAALCALVESATGTTSVFVNFCLTYRFDGPQGSDGV